MSIENDRLFDDMMAQYKAQEKPRNRKGNKHNKAKVMLTRLLKDGPATVSSIQMEAMLEGISWPTIERAKAAMDVEAFQVRGTGKITGWMWGLTLPADW